jgi:hypothetical protein
LPDASAVIAFAPGQQCGIGISDLLIDGGHDADRTEPGHGLFLRAGSRSNFRGWSFSGGQIREVDGGCGGTRGGVSGNLG